MQEDDKRYQDAKSEALKFLKNNRKLYGRCLGEIRIENESFNHLLWKNKNHKREIGDSYVRLICFKFINIILENLNLYQEYKCEMEQVKVKRKGKFINQQTPVHYYGFIGILFDKGLRIKVIIRKVEGWSHAELISVIPAWETVGYKDYKFKETFYECD